MTESTQSAIKAVRYALDGDWWPHSTALCQKSDIRALLEHVQALEMVSDAAEIYFRHYLQDEAEEPYLCPCGEEQSDRAAALRDALRALAAQPKGQA